MNLTIPTTASTNGPQYANEVNNSLSRIDAHNHSNGNGVPVTPEGLNISGDLTFNDNNATDVRSMRLTNNGSTLVLPSDIYCVYSINGDLWYNNDAGTPVQITSGGSIVGSSGNISGMTGNAAVVFSTDTYRFYTDTSIPKAANLDAGALLLRNLTPNSTYAMTVQPPASMTANSTVTLPSVPAATKILTMTSAGVINANFATDGVTVGVSSNNIYILNGGVGTTQLASSAVTTAKLADDSVTQAKIADNAVGTNEILAEAVTIDKLADSATAVSSNINATGNSVTPSAVASSSTTTFTARAGRPIIINLAPGSSASTSGFITLSSASLSSDTMKGYIQLRRNGTAIVNFPLELTTGITPTGNRQLVLPCSSLNYFDLSASGSTYYDLAFYVDATSRNISITNCQLVAVQL